LEKVKNITFGLKNCSRNNRSVISCGL